MDEDVVTPTDPGRAGMRPSWFILLGAFWLVLWMNQLTTVQLLLPQQLDTSVDGGDWTDGVVTFGLIFSVVGVAALATAPIAGRLSDGFAGRRRRPFLIVGVLLGASAMVFLGQQSSSIGVLVWYLIASIGLVTAQTAAIAMVADQVPPHARGGVTGVVSGTQAVGMILGVMVNVLLGLTVPMGYLFLGGALAVIGTVAAVMLPDPPVRRANTVEAKPADRATTESIGIWRTLREHRAFRTGLAGTVLLNMGNALVTAMLLYFLLHGLGLPIEAAEEQLLVATSVYACAAVIAAALGGIMSDRIGRRLPFIVATIAIQLTAAVILLVAPSLVTLPLAAALLGLSYGGFGSVNLAMMVDLAPDPSTAARDMSLVQIAQSAPQMITPVFGALLIAGTSGFAALFVATALLSSVALIVVWPLRTVVR
ncbi:MFS transporter [Stackebrandtia endophytica]|uniref:MFS transporter n=1 Tax=Stackebrandtia endophytica TaxID=1496996 RepID=A0A543AUL9_9ACTN|nr:MFS transporter [Stackebrandtia endophytica]TQL76272.1 MFS transporter [Stackebrandtia endophytica]